MRPNEVVRILFVELELDTVRPEGRTVSNMDLEKTGG
jgi:hypothetical protein